MPYDDKPTLYDYSYLDTNILKYAADKYIVNAVHANETPKKMLPQLKFLIERRRTAMMYPMMLKIMNLIVQILLVQLEEDFILL